jgi:hypothetical protein
MNNKIKKDIIELLRNAKRKLSDIEKYIIAQKVKDIIIELERDSENLNIRNNNGQVNITTGNSTINANQTKKFY